jgi:hypothetical protein
VNFAEAHIANLRAQKRALRYPPFAATPAAQGCGRVFGEGPLTYAQHLYALEYEHYLQTKLNPWKEATGAIDAQLDAFGVERWG